MRHREFLIDPHDVILEFYEILDEEYARSLCVNHFDIPQECISKIKCCDDMFKVYLVHSRRSVMRHK